MMIRSFWVLIFFLFQQFLVQGADRLGLNSPDLKNSVEIKMENGLPYYQISRQEKVLISWSELGLKLKSQPSYKGFNLLSATESKFSESWEPLWEKVSVVKNEYNELKVVLKEQDAPRRSLGITFRAYDDGISWYYELMADGLADSVVVEADLSAFKLPATGSWWSFNGERKNLGSADLSEMPEDIQLPFLFKRPGGPFIAIAESEIRDMANFTLSKSGAAGNRLSVAMDESILHLPGRTSWRVVLTGDQESQLIESTMTLNLNPPTNIKDLSWIRPGKSTWNWRGWGYKTASGFEYKIDTEAQMRFIDFAAKNNIQYHLIDANWYGPEFDDSSDPSVPKADFDVKKVLEHARKKDIGIFLYLNDVAAKKYGLERVLKQFHEWGAAGIKYGFMKGHGQEKVLHTRKVIELCAKYKLMLFFHDDPIPPSGDHRTWPHVLAREFGHAQADGKYSVYPESSINQPFINMLMGPLDMNFGWFDLTEAIQRTKVGEAVPGTVAGEIARMAAIFSGFICLPDVPEEYLAKSEMFDFIKRFPPAFDEYKVLDAQIDDYFSVARRADSDWVIASITNEKSREIKIRLDFLQEGLAYEASMYADAFDSHYLKNKETFRTHQRIVKKGDVLEAYIAPGGGHSVYLKMIP